jgi:hypothetical protein
VLYAPISRLTARLELNRRSMSGPLTTKWPRWYRMVRTIILFLPQSSSASRRTASHAGFFTLIQSGDRPAVGGALALAHDAFEAELAGCRKTVSPSSHFHVLVKAEPLLDWRQQNAARGRYKRAAGKTAARLHELCRMVIPLRRPIARISRSRMIRLITSPRQLWRGPPTMSAAARRRLHQSQRVAF